ncbi:MAG: metallophosphoesterase [FCB group bacterium]|jgi:2',3'-cyclic-nucleotide 2'-phosphodiesterase (5'-nucleotidase family)|nr:metallophosphoesterase [FCB group bacterium]
MKRAIAVTFILLLAWTAAAEPLHLVLLHSNDSHGTLLAPDAGNTPGDTGGIARVATVIRQTREENPGNVLVLHAGDVLSRGDALTQVYRGRLNFQLMQQIGYDVFTPGNGDFYGGVDRLMACRRATSIDFIKADAKLKSNGRTLLPPYIVKKVDGVRIAILGLGVVRGHLPSAAPLNLLDSIETAKRYVPKLRKKADIVIVLSHLGLKTDQLLAAQVPGIDLIVGGHSHNELFEPLRLTGPGGRAVTVAQAGNLDCFVGRLDLHLDKSKEGVRIERVEGRLIAMDATVTPDPRTMNTLQGKLKRIAEPASAKLESLKPAA